MPIFMKNFVFLFYFVGISAFAQSGAGSIGTNNGTSNLRLWVKADAGTNLSGNQLTNWTDLSGSSNTATAVASNNRPTRIPEALNGYPVMRFDGTNDYLEAGTTTSLNMTQWSFLVVGKINNNKNYNYWFGKGNDVTENYEFLSYADPFMHVPINFTDGTRGWLNTPTTSSVNNYAIWQYDYSTAGRNIYLNGTSVASDAVSKTPQTNNLVMWIGNERSTTGRFLDGDIAELIMFNTRQNDIQRTILQNYLSSKYNIPLTSPDVYAGDNNANGNYDYGVAGIGRSAGGNSHTSFSPSASNGLGMTYVSGFDNGDFVMVGHNLNTPNDQQFSDVAGMTGVAKARWRRVWYFDVTNTSTNIVANLSFDMSDGDVPTTVPAIPSNYVLLYRAGQTGTWTEVATATNISADAVNFNNQTLANDVYYTIGTRNHSSSPLPVNITAFWAVPQVAENQVLVNWETVSQGEVHHFDVLRSQDGVQWEMLAQVAGESNKKAYQIIDKNPLQGVSYYKLVLAEAGRQEQSYITSVQMDINVLVYPNPCSEKLIIEGCDTKQTLLTLYNTHGQKIQAQTSIKDDKTLWVDVQTLPAGMYYIDIRNNALKQSLKRAIMIQ
jgi:hypothetical protein